MNKNVAFTLAEILITLAIIGIVAAMTIPALIRKSNEAEYRSAAKKTYRDLSTALARITTENGGELWDKSSATDLTRATAMRNEFSKYITYIKAGSAATIMPSYHSYKQGVYTSRSGETWPAVILKNVMIYRFVDYLTHQTCTGTGVNGGTLNTSCGGVLVDTNGLKGPNVLGLDEIHFFIMKKPNNSYILSPSGSNNDGYACSTTASACNLSGQCGLGCTTNLIMDLPLP